MAELYIVAADGFERQIPLGTEPVSFGRCDESDIVLDEQRASRRHCEFRPCEGGWKVLDLGSSNGTFLGGQPVLSARLQPGDEIEIGETVIQYVADVEMPRPRRARKRRVKKPPFGMFALPVVLGIAAWFALGAWQAHSDNARADEWVAFARDTVARWNVSGETDGRASAINGALAKLPEGAEGDRARRILEAGRAASGGGDPVANDTWRAALSDLRGRWDATPAAARRTRLSELLDRHGGHPDAAAEIARLLIRLRDDGAKSDTRDQANTETESKRALEEGRYGDVLDLWNGWLARRPTLTREEERAFARRQDEISQLAQDAYEQTLAQAKGLVQEGRRGAAEELIQNSVAKLRGTGWDIWLRAGSGALGLETGVVAVSVKRSGAGSSSTRTRALAMRALASAEQMARQRRFSEAAERLEAAASEITDATLLGEMRTRVDDLRVEADVLRKVLAAVQDNPRPFTPLKLPDGKWKVVGATTDSLLISRGDEYSARSIVEVPVDVLRHLFGRARLEGRDNLSAALLLFDVGLRDEYVKAMRAALSAEDDTLIGDASEVHARLHGRPLPDGGYVAHPEIDSEIITYDEWRAIQNAKKIIEMTATLTKLVEKVESSPQAKSIDKVRKGFAALEKARNHALELIFDEVKYFYPYRDRMKEYMPVSREVDNRVKVVREAWAHRAKAHPKRDSKIDTLLSKAEDLEIEIEYLSGDAEPLRSRIETVERYLDRELTVMNFFETAADLALQEYNDRMMAENKITDTVATEDERRQVEITNEYRIMFGHRPTVKIQDQLTLAARGHSEDMARLGFFDHFSPVPGKRSPSDRVQAAGYPMMGASENIHMGSGDPRGAHNSWIHSSGHHRNILMPAWREMGTGRSGRHWTQNFGFRATNDGF